jgi:predicted GIY-YIG superfamily endonuclease
VSDQRFVYILISTIHVNRYYTGMTSDVAARVAAHNAGLSKDTASGRPWKGSRPSNSPILTAQRRLRSI